MTMGQRLKHHIGALGLNFILIASFTLGLPNMAHAQSSQKTSATETATLSASDAFRAAYDNRVEWVAAEVLTNVPKIQDAVGESR